MRFGSESWERSLPRLAGDGCLITAGVFGVTTGAAFVLEWLGVVPLGEPHGSGFTLVLSLLTWLLQVSAFALGPILAYGLHRGSFDKVAVLGLVLGIPIGGALVMPVTMIGALMDWLVGLFSSVPYAGAIAYLVLVVVAFAAIVVWMDADAVRDLARGRRAHVRLDLARLAATAGIAAFTIGVIAVILTGEDALEAEVFLLVAGVHGAGTVLAADVIARLIRSRVGGTATRTI